jgi:hypothetical protein
VNARRVRSGALVSFLPNADKSLPYAQGRLFPPSMSAFFVLGGAAAFRQHASQRVPIRRNSSDVNRGGGRLEG